MSKVLNSLGSGSPAEVQKLLLHNNGSHGYKRWLFTVLNIFRNINDEMIYNQRKGSPSMNFIEENIPKMNWVSVRRSLNKAPTALLEGPPMT